MYESLSTPSRCYYSAPISIFLQSSLSDWLSEMLRYSTDASPEQIAAWENCYHVLKRELVPTTSTHPALSIIFEYILPYEAGRRPDVLIVGSNLVLILEFKMKRQVLRADIDQVAAYARDLQAYHFESREKQVVPALVLTKANDPELFCQNQNVHICSGRKLSVLLQQLIHENTLPCDVEKWMDSKYEPLPSIVDAARMIMSKEALPSIRTVNSTTIPEALNCLENVVRYARDKKKHMLALVTGVPGAGKTYLGLQFVYDVCESDDHVNSVYLSGNGPLIQVLSSALKSNVFVKDLHRQIKEYLSFGAKDFNKNVVVFDEGQRAWNAEQMSSKRSVSRSEPDLMIQLMESRLDWSVLLVLVGEGQEIYVGEETDLAQWNTALSYAHAPWEVVCPEKLASVFTDARRVHPRNQLDLTVSLRTHLAQDVSSFANDVINGNIVSAKSYLAAMKDAGFTTLLTRNLDQAKAYCRNRYTDHYTKRYGLIVSSKANTQAMQRFGVDNSFQATSLRNMDIGSWYNAEPSSSLSCCNLEKVVTEFGCQGLELDMPILCWAPDMIWREDHWQLFKTSQPYDSKDNTYRRNSYRVLLTRGRDGLILYIPEINALNNTYHLFRELGFDLL